MLSFKKKAKSLVTGSMRHDKIKKSASLEGWDREGGREGDARGKRYGDICICITDSLCYKAEAVKGMG